MNEFTEQDLLAADVEQARLVRSGKIEDLIALLHPDYRAYLTNGRILFHGEMLDLVRSGSLAREHFEREQKAAIVSGTTGVV